MYEPNGVTCPNCHAQPGKPCNQPTEHGRRDVKWIHHSRIAEAVSEANQVRVTYRVSATVNGEPRHVIMPGPRGLGGGQVLSELLFNTEDNYKRFYRGAGPEDYEAELEDLLIEVHDWSELE